MKDMRYLTGTMMAAALMMSSAAFADVDGWLNWRGPEGIGVSREKGLPDILAIGTPVHRWTIKIAGGGTPVVAGNKVYGFGYRGTGPDLQEVLFCANAETGKILWEHGFNDFLSDITYDRYTIGSPTVDAETGNVYVMTSAGEFVAYSSEGKLVFRIPMMEGFGRLTFTNGRTGAATIEKDLVIIRGVTSNWGADGPAMDRLYAFDKKTGAVVWSASPGKAPKDNTFGRPIFGWLNGKRVLYTGSGDGSLVCVNARNGQTIWRLPVSAGGMNATVVLHKGKVIGIHGDENLDSSEKGRMLAVKVDAKVTPVEGEPPLLDKTAEVWRNKLTAVSSTPVLVGDTLYETTATGQLNAVNANTGAIVWTLKLAPDQLHASPTYADGKLYIPFQNGMLYVIKPTATKGIILSKTQLAGRGIGAPAVWNGRVYVFTTGGLYCFGNPTVPKNQTAGLPKDVVKYPAPGPATSLQVIPNELLLRTGDKAKVRIRSVDANGLPVKELPVTDATFASFVPPTAKVKSTLDGAFDQNGVFTAGAPSAGAFKATIGPLSGTLRGRSVQPLPFNIDFENFNPTEPDVYEPGPLFAYPPLPWIGARGKFDVRDLDNSKVFAKTLDNIFFQRATVFFGHPDEKDYTITAEVRADGSKRTMSTVGLVCQRYYVILNGNAQELEINSNQERIKAIVPFKMEPETWYVMSARVDVQPDGSGIVRAKVWPKGQPEPAKWTIEVKHKNVHRQGSPGIFGFSPQSLYKVYVDNISVKSNR